jgi:hypothetical protein
MEDSHLQLRGFKRAIREERSHYTALSCSENFSLDLWLRPTKRRRVQVLGCKRPANFDHDPDTLRPSKRARTISSAALEDGANVPDRDDEATNIELETGSAEEIAPLPNDLPEALPEPEILPEVIEEEEVVVVAVENQPSLRRSARIAALRVVNYKESPYRPPKKRRSSKTRRSSRIAKLVPVSYVA